MPFLIQAGRWLKLSKNNMTNQTTRFWVHLIVFVIANSAILTLVPASYKATVDVIWNAIQVAIAFYDKTSGMAFAAKQSIASAKQAAVDNSQAQ